MYIMPLGLYKYIIKIRKDKRTMKKTSGFTLVELIVVIAILAILAGIAIPVYSGYIAKAKEANDIQAMDAIKTATGRKLQAVEGLLKNPPL